MRKLPRFIGALFAVLLSFSVLAAADAGLININTADAGTLTQLNGIGPAKAAAIVAYRDANGPFTSLDELGKVKGIGATLVSRLSDQATVGE